MKIHLHFIVVIVLHSIQADITGLITLDSLSFNKTLRAFPYSFIKFDTISPSGPKHETFLTLVKDLLEVEKIFLADVHIPGEYILSIRSYVTKNLVSYIGILV